MKPVVTCSLSAAQADIKHYGAEKSELSRRCENATAAECGEWDAEYTSKFFAACGTPDGAIAIMCAHVCRAWATVKIANGDTTAREATPHEVNEWYEHIKSSVPIPAI